MVYANCPCQAMCKISKQILNFALRYEGKCVRGFMVKIRKRVAFLPLCTDLHVNAFTHTFYLSINTNASKQIIILQIVTISDILL